MHALTTWLMAGAPPNYVYVLGAYALGCFILSKIPKVRANETIEAIMNVVNPRVVPIVRLIPVLGPVLAGFLELWDSPSLVIPPKAPPKMPLPALLPLLLIPALLSFGCAGALNGVRQSLTASAKLLQATADTFKQADLDYQRALEKKPDAEAELKKYRTEQRPKIMQAFVDAGAALSLAQVTCAAVDAGMKSKKDLAGVMVQVFVELKGLQQALAAVGILPRTSMRWWRPQRRLRLALDGPLDCEMREDCRELVWPGDLSTEVL